MFNIEKNCSNCKEYAEIVDEKRVVLWVAVYRLPSCRPAMLDIDVFESMHNMCVSFSLQRPKISDNITAV